VGAPDQWELCGYGIGLVGGLLALASLRWRERRGERIALLVVTVIACEIARGGDGFLHPLLARTPLFAALRCPARALYIWTVAAPLLAADGFDALTERRPGWLRPLVVGALALELLVTWRAENPSQTLAAAEARPAAVDWLRDNGPPFRATNDVHLGQAFHNMGLRWRFESAGGYHSLPIWRYLHLLWIANHGKPYPKAQLGDDLTAQGLWRFESPIVDLLGVGWVMAPRDRPIKVPGWTRVFTGDDGIDVWKNGHHFPRAFVVYGAEQVADDAAAAQAVASSRWRPDLWAIVEEPVGLPSPADGPLPLPTGHTQLVRESPNTFFVEMKLPRPGLLVVPEPWYPGWRATVDGQPAPLLRVDYALRGVKLPAGTHIVEMELTNPALASGACVTIAALLCAAALAGWDGRRRRKAVLQ
jgi:hypothetical protein